jgi:hypothetical protein
MKSILVATLAGMTLFALGCGGTSKPTLQCGSAALHSQTSNACGAMDAKAVGDANGHCLCIMGFAWDGSQCVALGDCACEGADCSKLTETIEECQAAHATCSNQLALSCGSSALYSKSHDVCGAMDVKDQPDENGNHCKCMMGFAWNGTECVGLGDCACVGADCDKLTETIEACQAQHLSCSSVKNKLSCGSAALTSKSFDACTAMDAQGVADDSGVQCRCVLGFVWDGSQCLSLGGCACLGADCDKLTSTLEECEAKHTSCTSKPSYTCGAAQLRSKVHAACAAMDAVAEGDANGHCLCMLGYAWNGSDCVGLGDCACVGADCDKLTETRDECLAKHTGC